MQFLHLNECTAWCRRHGGIVDEAWKLAPDPTLQHISRIVFAPSGSVGLEAAAEAACLQAVSPYDQALLWIREWGIWPSAEDWPRFYTARGSRGERSSLEEKPGHVFEGSTDTSELALFLRMVLDQGWGAHLLAARQGRILRRLWISHDGWIELGTDEPVSFALSAT